MDPVRLCGVDEMETGTAKRFDLAGHRICLVRIEDDFYAVGDRCSHANFSLAEGEVYPEERESPSRCRPPGRCRCTPSWSRTAT
jgi:nitrite reductase/ring-hydroxylating ferredoxin subunit